MERNAEHVDAPTGHTDGWEMISMETLFNQTEMNPMDPMDPMDPKLWTMLGEDLLAKIITRLPLKEIVQSQVLSKQWRTRFQSSSFQEEVSKLSSRWGPSNFYHPLYLTEKGLCGYDRSTQKWKDLCTLPEFPPDFNETSSSAVVGSRWRLWGRNCWVAGALVFSARVSNDDMLHIFVTNPVNRTGRKCPPLQLSQRIEQAQSENIFAIETMKFHVHFVGHHHYKMVLVAVSDRARKFRDNLTVTVFDSKLNSWTKFQSNFPTRWSTFRMSVYVRGVIYVPYNDYEEEYDKDVLGYCAFDVEKGLFRKLIPSPPIFLRNYGSALAGPSRSQLILVSRPYDFFPHTGFLFSILNLEKLEVTELPRFGPVRTFGYMWIPMNIAASEGNYVHVMLGIIRKGVSDPVTDQEASEKIVLMSFDLSKRLWSYTLVDRRECGHNTDERIEPWVESAFQPNFSPFVVA